MMFANRWRRKAYSAAIDAEFRSIIIFFRASISSACVSSFCGSHNSKLQAGRRYFQRIRKTERVKIAAQVFAALFWFSKSSISRGSQKLANKTLLEATTQCFRLEFDQTSARTGRARRPCTASAPTTPPIAPTAKRAEEDQPMLLVNVSRRLTDCTRHADTSFSLSNFERSVLGSSKTKVNGTILVGKMNRWNALD